MRRRGRSDGGTGLRYGAAVKSAALALATTLLAGCVVVPRTADVYDEQCRAYVKQVVLETEVIGAIGHCRGDECVAMLAAAGIIATVSAVISGSVAIVGNIAFWAERRGQCPGGTPPPPVPGT